MQSPMRVTDIVAKQLSMTVTKSKAEKINMKFTDMSDVVISWFGVV